MALPSPQARPGRYKAYVSVTQVRGLQAYLGGTFLQACRRIRVNTGAVRLVFTRPIK